MALSFTTSQQRWFAADPLPGGGGSDARVHLVPIAKGMNVKDVMTKMTAARVALAAFLLLPLGCETLRNSVASDEKPKDEKALSKTASAKKKNKRDEASDSPSRAPSVANISAKPRPPEASPSAKSSIDRSAIANSVSRAQGFEELGQRLAKGSPDPSARFAFETLHGARPRLFHHDGGHIYATTGLLEQVTSRDDLAALLALEMATIISDAGSPVTAEARESEPSPKAPSKDLDDAELARDLLTEKVKKRSPSQEREIERIASEMLAKANVKPARWSEIRTRLDRLDVAEKAERPSRQLGRAYTN